MLVAKRDPFHPAAQNTSHSDFAAYPETRRTPRVTRAMTALQMMGTLLGIPVALASGYTMYRVNYSPEASCQSLRAGIVSMLDKSVDARTRHMLVRKDVEKFELTCGSVDPDATAAFKSLLESDRHAAARPQIEPKPVREKPKEAARKPEPKVEVHEATAAAKPGDHDPAISDSAWLAAVRGALISDAVSVKPPRVETAKAPEADALPSKPPAVVREAQPKLELHTSSPTVQPAPTAPPDAAPALPPPANVATVPASPPDDDHPVPPAAVPMVAEAQPQGWVSHIPFVGRMLESNKR